MYVQDNLHPISSKKKKSVKIHFRTKKITKNAKGHYATMKEYIHQKDITTKMCMHYKAPD